MNDAVEQNTRWIAVWVLNDPDEHFWEARRVAQEAKDADDYDILRRHLEGILRGGGTEVIRLTAREMSEADYDNTDWAEVASCLLD